jgi:hypothetical protein
MIAFVDTEGTGVRRGTDQFHQISVLFTTDDLKIIELENLYVTPTIGFTHGATQVTGVTMRLARMMSKGKGVVNLEEEMSELIGKINGCKVIGQNVDFDLGIITTTIHPLKINLEKVETEDTMKIYKDILKIQNKKHGIKFPNLGEIEVFLNTKMPMKASEIFKKLFKFQSKLHDSRYDVFVTFLAYKYFKEHLEKKVC